MPFTTAHHNTPVDLIMTSRQNSQKPQKVDCKLKRCGAVGLPTSVLSKFNAVSELV